MPKVESKMSVDMVWTDEKPEKKPTHLIVYYQQEHGYASALAGKGLIGKQEPIAKIYSNLMTVNAINYIPSPFWPEYRLYEVYNNNGERTFILRIPNLHPVAADIRPHANPMVWLYTYPIVRDIVMLLNDVGVNRMTYLTSNLFKYHPDFDDFGEIEHGHVVEYDFTRLTDEVEKRHNGTSVQVNDDFVIAPNVWIWCDVFASFCSNTPRFSEVILGHVGTGFVDSDTADTMLRHLGEKYGLNYDEEALEDLSYKLNEMGKATRVNAEDVFGKPDNFNTDDFFTGNTGGEFKP